VQLGAKIHCKITANAKIHSKRQNSRLPWIPWIRDFRLALAIPSESQTIKYSDSSRCVIKRTYNVRISRFIAACSARIQLADGPQFLIFWQTVQHDSHNALVIGTTRFIVSYPQFYICCINFVFYELCYTMDYVTFLCLHCVIIAVLHCCTLI